MKWVKSKYIVFIVLFAIALIIASIINSNNNAKPSAEPLIPSLKPKAIENSHELLHYLVYIQGQVGMMYKLYITNDGSFRHDVSLNDELFANVRTIGPSAQFQSDAQLIALTGTTTFGATPNSYFINPDVPLCNPIVTNPSVAFFCLMHHLRFTLDRNLRAENHFATCTILATTKIIRNESTYNLVQTYLGLGILVVPRGSVLSSSQFYSGYVPLFDDLGMPRCGQAQSVQLNDGIECGNECATILPDETIENPDLIWELTSPNKLYKICFFDNGLCTFARYNELQQVQLPLIYTNSQNQELVNVTFPQCRRPLTIPAFNDPNVHMDNVRDKWIVRATRFRYMANSYNTTANNMDISIQVTDNGSLILVKDYLYDAHTSHPMIQSSMPELGAIPIPGLVVGDQPINDDGPPPRGLHFRLGENLLCFGYEFMSRWEINNGAEIARTEINEGANRYILWMSHFGLRLLYCSYPLTYQSLQDWTNCLWITPIYRRWFYVRGDMGTTPFNQSITVCDNTVEVPMPPYPNLGCLEFNGTFPKPGYIPGFLQTLTPNVIACLRSPNKRYVFEMMNNGRCDFWDLNGNVNLFSTNNYNVI